jgi:hypothetical protein
MAVITKAVADSSPFSQWHNAGRPQTDFRVINWPKSNMRVMELVPLGVFVLQTNTPLVHDRGGICIILRNESHRVLYRGTVTKTSERPFPGSQPIADRKSTVCVISCHELRACPYWQHAFASQHKDHRYYDLINETIHPEFKYLYFVLKDAKGEIRAIQPFFIIDQDILAGARPYLGHLIDVIRHQWSRFMFVKTLMVGCVAGEGQLDDGSDAERAANAELLAWAIEKHAQALAARLIVLKEFPDSYRRVLACFERRGFIRIPRSTFPWFESYQAASASL